MSSITKNKSIAQGDKTQNSESGIRDRRRFGLRVRL